MSVGFAAKRCRVCSQKPVGRAVVCEGGLGYPVSRLPTSRI